MDMRDMNDDQLNKALGLEYTALKLAEKRYDELKSEWYRRHGKEVGTEFSAAGVQIHLGVNRRWNEEAARERLSRLKGADRIIKELEVTVLDSKKAKKKLPPEIYEQCSKVYGVRFNVGFGE